MSTAIVPPVRDPQAVPAASFRRTFWAFVSGVALLLLFGALIWFVIARAAPGFEDIDRKREGERYKFYSEVIEGDQKALNGPADWVNKEKGVVRLPLAQAMQLTLADLQNSKPHPAYPIAQSSPAPAPAPPTDNKAALPAPDATQPPPPTGGQGGTPSAGSADQSNPAPPAGAPVPATTPTTTNANNTVLPKQPDAAASSGPANPAASPTPDQPRQATPPR